MEASMSGINQLRQLINKNQELIRAFMASDHDTALALLVSWGKAQGVDVTAQEIQDAIKAKGTSSPGHPVTFSHHASTANTTPF